MYAGSTSDADSKSDDSHDQGGVPGPILSIRSNPAKSQRTIDVQAFEFISNEDKDGARRARSHAVKRFRRQQTLEKAEYQIMKQKSSGRNIGARPSQSVVKVPHQVCAPTSGSTPPCLGSGLSLLEGGSVDPFHSFPIQLESPRDVGLVHYCMSEWSRYCIAEC